MTIQNTDLFLVDRGGTNYKLTYEDLADEIGGGGGGGGGDIPSGTKMIFYQSAAPTGWVKDTSIDNTALRIVSGSGGTTSGSVGFTSAFQTQAINVSINSSTNSSSISGSISGTTGDFTPAGKNNGEHSHVLYDQCANNSANVRQGGGNNGELAVRAGTTGGDTAIGGQSYPHSHSINTSISGGSHSHSFSASGSDSINLNVKYANVIICTKS